MRVRVEIGTDVSEKEIILRTNEYDEEVERMLSMLQKIQKTPQLIFYKNSTEYFFSADKILFFETSERQVYAHTKNDVFVVKHRLYELEDILNYNFHPLLLFSNLPTFQVDHRQSQSRIRFDAVYFRMFDSICEYAQAGLCVEKILQAAA